MQILLKRHKPNVYNANENSKQPIAPNSPNNDNNRVDFNNIPSNKANNLNNNTNNKIITSDVHIMKLLSVESDSLSDIFLFDVVSFTLFLFLGFVFIGLITRLNKCYRKY